MRPLVFPCSPATLDDLVIVDEPLAPCPPLTVILEHFQHSVTVVHVESMGPMSGASACFVTITQDRSGRVRIITLAGIGVVTMYAVQFSRHLLGVILLAASTGLFATFDPGLAPFEVRVNGEPVHYREFGIYLMPGEDTTFDVPAVGPDEVSLFVAEGRPVREGPGTWRWTAPESAGLHRVHILRSDDALVTLNVFVLRPLTDVVDGELNGYRIGYYPHPVREIHAAPRGLVEVTEALAAARVSPHFTLGQFLCRQQPGHWPKYLVLQPTLVTKLERLLEEVNHRGIRTDTFYVMSGYRTPWYNRSIGNVPYSRHVWGAAADIFIDTRGDGRMDDLTGNGSSGLADAKVLHRIVDERFGASGNARPVIGLGLYGPRPHRGPFVHVDVRDERARWAVP